MQIARQLSSMKSNGAGSSHSSTPSSGRTSVVSGESTLTPPRALTAWGVVPRRGRLGATFFHVSGRAISPIAVVETPCSKASECCVLVGNWYLITADLVFGQLLAGHPSLERTTTTRVTEAASAVGIGDWG